MTIRQNSIGFPTCLQAMENPCPICEIPEATHDHNFCDGFMRDYCQTEGCLNECEAGEDYCSVCIQNMVNILYHIRNVISHQGRDAE